MRLNSPRCPIKLTLEVPVAGRRLSHTSLDKSVQQTLCAHICVHQLNRRATIHSRLIPFGSALQKLCCSIRVLLCVSDDCMMKRRHTILVHLVHIQAMVAEYLGDPNVALQSSGMEWCVAVLLGYVWISSSFKQISHGFFLARQNCFHERGLAASFFNDVDVLTRLQSDLYVPGFVVAYCLPNVPIFIREGLVSVMIHDVHWGVGRQGLLRSVPYQEQQGEAAKTASAAAVHGP
mmetsp:Transcript_105109/g.201749  ORF Transcript_105109/g.201749 Transcript_105109/m.201749 type:complete len:234 (+) Transcript_105109:99-800(+)